MRCFGRNKSFCCTPVRCKKPAKLAKNLVFDNYDATMEQTGGKEFKLPELQRRPLVLRTRPQRNSYCVPDSSNFPSVDSLLYFNSPNNSSPTLLMLQMTRAKKHDVKVEGLHHIEELGIPPGVRKHYVVITPNDVFTKITLPLAYFSGSSLTKVMKSPNEVFQTLSPRRTCSHKEKVSLEPDDGETIM